MQKHSCLKILILIYFISASTLCGQEMIFGGGTLYNYNYGYNKLLDRFNYKPVDISTKLHFNWMIMIELPISEKHWAGFDFGVGFTSKESAVKLNDSMSITIPPNYFNLGLAYSFDLELGCGLYINPICRAGLTLPTFSITNDSSKNITDLNDILNEVNPGVTDISSSGYYIFLGFQFKFTPFKKPKPPENYTPSEEDLENPISIVRSDFVSSFIIEAGFVTSSVDHWRWGGYSIKNMPNYAFTGFLLTFQGELRQSNSK